MCECGTCELVGGGYQRHEAEWGVWAVRWGTDADGRHWAKVGKLDPRGAADAVFYTQARATRMRHRADALELAARRAYERLQWTEQLELCLLWCIVEAGNQGLKTSAVCAFLASFEERKRRHVEDMAVPSVRVEGVLAQGC